MEFKEGFAPSIWPEGQPPSAYISCDLCELSKQRKRVVWGEGNPQAKLVVLLDNPGLREDAEGNPFVCGTRQTLQLAAHEAGLSQEEVFVTYVLKCRPVRTYDKPVCRSTCLDHLQRQLASSRPKLLFCMGNAAVQAFWEDPEAEVKALRGALHTVNGQRCAVTYHPLAVRRRPNLYRLFLDDWRLAAKAARMDDSVIIKENKL